MISKNKYSGYILIFILMILWEVFSIYYSSPFFPSLTTSIHSVYESIIFENFLQDVFLSISHSLISIIIAASIMIPFGILIGRIEILFNLLIPLINLLRPLPSSAIIPLAILFLGIGVQMKLFVIVFGCSWPILLNTIDGVKSIEPMYLRTSNVLGFSYFQKFKLVIIPASLPTIFTGIRISLAISFILTITVEMIVGSKGIGYFIIDKERSFMFPEMYGGIFTLGILGILINNSFNLLDRFLNKWHYEKK